MAKRKFDLEEAVGRHERHARAQLETHVGEYKGYYAKEGDTPQEISDVVREKFSAMMGYIGGRIDQLDVNYKWADKNVKPDGISDEYKLFEFTKKFAAAIGHEIGDYDISNVDGQDRMRSRILEMIKAVGGLSDEEAQAKIKELIDSKGESDEAINLLKGALRAQRSNSIVNDAFNRYDLNLTADEARQFSAAIRAYEHEISGRRVRKDYLPLATSKELRQREFTSLYNIITHPQHSIPGQAGQNERVVDMYMPTKYTPQKPKK